MQRQIQTLALRRAGDWIADRRRRQRSTASRWAGCPALPPATRAAARRAADEGPSGRAGDRPVRSLPGGERREPAALRAGSLPRGGAGCARPESWRAARAPARPTRPAGAPPPSAARPARRPRRAGSAGRHRACRTPGSADGAGTDTGAGGSPRPHRARSPSPRAGAARLGTGSTSRAARVAAATAGSLVTTSPPNIVLTCLPLPKLWTAAAARAPTGSPSTSAPTAWAASSITTTPGGRAAAISPIGAVTPSTWVGITARVRGPTAAAMVSPVTTRRLRADGGDANVKSPGAEKPGHAWRGVRGHDDLVARLATGVRQNGRHAAARRAHHDGVARPEEVSGRGLELVEPAAPSVEKSVERRRHPPRHGDGTQTRRG